VKDEPTTGANDIGMPAELESDNVPQLRRKYKELAIKFNNLNQEYNVLANSHHTLLIKYRKERETIKAWSIYIEKYKQSRRRSRPTTSTNPSDDELARSIFPTGTSAGDPRTPCIGTPSSISPKVSCSPPPLGRTVQSPSSSRSRCASSPNPTDPRDDTPTEREYSPTDTLPKTSRHHANGSLDFGPPIPEGSQQLLVRTEIQCSSKTQVGGYDSAETTDGEIERRSPLPSPNTITMGRGHHSPKAVPKDHASSPGTPVVVSERCLKRKMTSHYGSVTKPIRIKSEHGSSSPAGLAGLRDHCDISESLDLDEVGEKVDTPRKRKRLGRVSLQSHHHTTNSLLGDPNPSLLNHSFQSSLEFIRKAKDDRPDPRGDEETVPRFSESGDGSLQRMEEAPPKEDIASRATGKLDGANAQRHFSSLGLKLNPRASVLRPGNTNIRLSHTIKDSKPKNSYSRLEDGLEKTMANAHYLVEDGEGLLGITTDETIVSTAENAGKGVGQTPDERGSRHRRLVTLLNEGSPRKPVLSPGKHLSKNSRQSAGRALPRDVQSHRDATIQGDDELDPRQHHAVPGQDRTQPLSTRANSRARGEPKSRSVEFADPNYRRLANSGSKRKQRSEPPSLDAVHDSRRLRDRPLHSLTLDDFKVNPNYINSGFAFVETVRNRDQRKCLPGCIKPACCGGTFRKALELGGIPTPTPPKIGLFWNSSQEQEDEEQRLLEDYVGDDRGLLDKLNPEARRELVIQARTKQFADKHGRHRQAFERQATPPGFWRTDMPTSQEFEQDREESKRIEIGMVEQRYKEARRGRGKWIFRDE
jgi:hypothetical protein